MPPNTIKLNRLASWLLVPAALGTVFTGYIYSYNVISRQLGSAVHLWFEFFFIALLLTHIAFTLTSRSSWRSLLHKVRERKASRLHWLKIVQRVTAWGIALCALLVIISGLDWYALGFGGVLPFAGHLAFDVPLVVIIVLHVAAGARFALARRGVRGAVISASLLAVALVLSLLVVFVNVDITGSGTVTVNGETPNNGLPDNVTPPDNETIKTNATVSIGNESYTFHPEDVDAIRTDVFQPGHFSMFDVLVQLDNEGAIDMEYHFDGSVDTHVIDSLNGQTRWWYRAWYDGGWRESNSFRMDLYPWKEGATLEFYRVGQNKLDVIYADFADEVERLQVNGGQVIIPEVSISGPTTSEMFFDVVVTPHDLRSGALREGVVTAIDVIMSLADRGLITYQLQWYDSIGRADIVRSYWVEAINDDVSYGGCGFVYEAGSKSSGGFRGNHFHLPSDMRVLTSPEYESWFWICL